MNLNPVASNLIIAWYLGLSLILTLTVIVLTLVLHKLNSRLEALTAKVEPTTRHLPKSSLNVELKKPIISRPLILGKITTL